MTTNDPPTPLDAALFVFDYCSEMEGASFGDRNTAEEVVAYLAQTPRDRRSPDDFDRWRFGSDTRSHAR